jgi:GH25 family lysozyme M1 (1,4-beta-N-acetylmuramidase)
MPKMANYPIGIDVSRWQGLMDWQKAAQAGATFAFIRAGSHDASGPYEDYQFRNNVGPNGAPAHIPEIGFYWYFRPAYRALAQADFLADLLNSEFFTRPYNFSLWCDIEQADGQSSDDVAQSVLDFCVRLEVITGIKPGIYTRATFFNPYVAASPEWASYKLWIARYITGLDHPWGDADRVPYVKPRDWDTWHYWQWSADGNFRGAEFGASSAHIDINYKNEILSEPELPPIIEDERMLILKAQKTVAAGATYPDNAAVLTVPEGKRWYVEKLAGTVDTRPQRIFIAIAKAGSGQNDFFPLLDEHPTLPTRWYGCEAFIELSQGDTIQCRAIGAQGQTFVQLSALINEYDIVDNV